MRGYSSCVRVSFWWGIKLNSGGRITSGKLAGFAAGEGEIMNLLGSPFTSGTEKLQHCLQSCKKLNGVFSQSHVEEFCVL